MPELPEVEVVRRGLELGVVGRTVSGVEVLHPRAVRRHVPGAADFATLLVGRRITGTRRRGKYLWLPLDSGDALLGHLGMSGQLLVVAPDRPDEVHLRVRIRFQDEGGREPRELRFVDQRTFGGLLVAAGGAALPECIAHIALDPLDPAFDDDVFIRRLRSRRTGLKRALLDQSLVSGIGNIYADEALWRVPLHWARPTETLPRPLAQDLLRHVRAVLAEAIGEGGTSFDALYVSADGVSGRFERALNAYGRAGQPCRRCGTAMVREEFMNRSSYRCPRCQRQPPRPRW